MPKPELVGMIISKDECLGWGQVTAVLVSKNCSARSSIKKGQWVEMPHCLRRRRWRVPWIFRDRIMVWKCVQLSLPNFMPLWSLSWWHEEYKDKYMKDQVNQCSSTPDRGKHIQDCLQHHCPEMCINYCLWYHISLSSKSLEKAEALYFIHENCAAFSYKAWCGWRVWGMRSKSTE